MKTIALVALLLASCASANGPQAPAPRRPSAARIDVRDSEGASTNDVRAMFGPAIAPLQHCLPDTGGVLNVVVRSVDGALTVTVAPGSSTDATARTCAVQTLHQTYLSETGSNAGGLTVPPSGFTSHLTVSW